MHSLTGVTSTLRYGGARPFECAAAGAAAAGGAGCFYLTGVA